MKKRILGGLLIIALGVGGLALWKLEPRARVGSGHGAKLYGSSIYVSGRHPGHVRDSEFDERFDILSFTHDHDEGLAHAGFTGLANASAYHRPGFGCTLLHGMSPEELDAQIAHVAPREPAATRWITDGPRPFYNSEQVEAALDAAFSEPDPKSVRGTRAVVVVHQGHIIGERYAPGFTADTPLIGWSMTKSVTSTLVGMLVQQGLLDIDAAVPIAAWSEDDRAEITLDHLLRMTSSLSWSEVYDEGPSDVTAMLYGEPDMASYAIERPLSAKPGSTWKYSSGTSMILSHLVAKTLSEAGEDHISFPHKALFEPLGMHSAVLELDNTGTFVGSSYLFASARDWARYGLLYLNRGLCHGERLLSEEWIDYSLRPTPESEDEKFGAHWWLNSGRKEWPSLPESAYAARGYEGQYTLILPEQDLVIVRLGLSRPGDAFNIEELVEGVLKALPLDS